MANLSSSMNELSAAKLLESCQDVLVESSRIEAVARWIKSDERHRSGKIKTIRFALSSTAECIKNNNG